ALTRPPSPWLLMMNQSLLFPIHGFDAWNGGVDVARVFATAVLHPRVKRRFEVVFALPVPSPGQVIVRQALRRWRLLLAGVPGSDEAGGPSALQRNARNIAQGQVSVFCKDSPRGVLNAARQCNVDVIFPTMLPLGPGKTPRVSYL